MEIPKESIDEQIKENFFKIWITKELIHKNIFENYYKTFLNKNGVFDIEKYKKDLNSIYKLISQNNVTSIRPNNSNKLKAESIEVILKEIGEEYKEKIGDKFSKDLITHFITEIEVNLNYNLSKKENSNVKKGLENFLNLLFHNGTYQLGTIETIDEIVNKTIKILIGKKES